MLPMRRPRITIEPAPRSSGTSKAVTILLTADKYLTVTAVAQTLACRQRSHPIAIVREGDASRERAGLSDRGDRGRSRRRDREHIGTRYCERRRTRTGDVFDVTEVIPLPV